MALSYLKCLLRFGPGFTCWAIWESWAACSVVPCTADVCEGDTELLLLLLCTSSIINCKKSKGLNSVHEKCEHQIGAQLPGLLYRLSVHKALSHIGAFFVTSPVAPRASHVLLEHEGKEAVGPFHTLALRPQSSTNPSLEQGTVFPWPPPASKPLSAPGQPSAVTCIDWISCFLPKNKVKSWGLGSQQRQSIATKDSLALGKRVLQNMLSKLPAKPIWNHLKVCKARPGIPIKAESTQVWVLNPAEVNGSPCNPVTLLSFQWLYIYLFNILASSPLWYWGIQGCWMHALGWWRGWTNLEHYETMGECSVFVTGGLKLLKGQLLWDWKLQLFLWKCESLLFPYWDQP